MIYRAVSLQSGLDSKGLALASNRIFGRSNPYSCSLTTRHLHQTISSRPTTASVLRPCSNSQSRSLSLLRPRFRGREWTWPQLTRHVVRHEPLVLAAVLLSTSVVAFALYQRAKRKRLARRLGSFPPKVGIALDRAIYFTQHEPDPQKAMDAFVTALQAAAEAGLDPLSDEVIGVRVELTKSLEWYGSRNNAIQILQDIKTNCLTWIEDHASDPTAASRRNKLLSWACRVSTRLADLYGHPSIGNDKKAEECLVWAVETTLKERQRRQSEGVAPDKDHWLDDDETGSMLENMAHMYESRDQHYYASQLFLSALSLKTELDCHTVILMNNLAASLAQQRAPPEQGSPSASSTQLRDSGKSWALQALTLSQKIKPPERTQECDVGCVVATHNLGEFAEMDGNIAEARERYEQAASLAHAYQFEEGVVSADEGLKRLRGWSGR